MRIEDLIATYGAGRAGIEALAALSEWNADIDVRDRSLAAELLSTGAKIDILIERQALLVEQVDELAIEKIQLNAALQSLAVAGLGVGLSNRTRDAMGDVVSPLS